MKIKAQKINEIFYFTYLIQSKAWINTKFSGLKTLSIFDPIFFTFNRPKKDLYVWSRMNERSFIWLMSAEDRHIWISCLHVDLNYWKQSPDVKNWLTGKDPDAGKDWGQEEKWTTEDEMAGWHHWLDGCESWTVKKAEHWRIDAFELWCWRKLLRVPWTARRSNQSIPEGDQAWDFFGRNDAEAETPVLWPPHVKSWLIGKDPDVGKDWRQEEKGTTEDEMVGWHHWLNGHEFG